jgi:hypothetical protein
MSNAKLSSWLHGPKRGEDEAAVGEKRLRSDGPRMVSQSREAKATSRYTQRSWAAFRSHGFTSTGGAMSQSQIWRHSV